MVVVVVVMMMMMMKCRMKIQNIYQCYHPINTRSRHTSSTKDQGAKERSGFEAEVERQVMEVRIHLKVQTGRIRNSSSIHYCFNIQLFTVTYYRIPCSCYPVSPAVWPDPASLHHTLYLTLTLTLTQDELPPKVRIKGQLPPKVRINGQLPPKVRIKDPSTP